MQHSAAFFLLLVALTAADCPPGSIYDGNFDTCYQFVNMTMSFLDAEEYCYSMGGHLADEANAFESNDIAMLARVQSSQKSNFWIGANLLRSVNWSWTSDAPMLFTNWAKGEPNNAYSCAYVNVTQTTWVTTSCNTQLPFMCKMNPNTAQPGTRSTVTPTPSSVPSVCPLDSHCTDGYTLYQENCMCYRYFGDLDIFSDANAQCAKNGGMLAKILSKDVNGFLTALPGFNTEGLECPWIGLFCNSTATNSCSWVDGTPLFATDYTNFYSFGPGGYAIVSVITPRNAQDGTWERNDANKSRSYICQKAPTSLRPESMQENGRLISTEKNSFF